MVAVSDLLWTPSVDMLQTTRLGSYLQWLDAHRQQTFEDYEQLWQWSVDDLEGFWSSVAEHFEVHFESPPRAVLGSREMPGARWFPGATLNYAEHALRRRGEDVAVFERSQTRADSQLSWDGLREQVARCRQGFLGLGIERGDRIVAVLPNGVEALVAFLAAASLGAIWASCPPEFGATSVIDRFKQLEPRLLLAVGGYRYGSKSIDRGAQVREIRDALPSLEAVIDIPYAGESIDDAISWRELLAESGPLIFDPVPFGHPLYVLFSSGTTGLPKAIVHGHGGILVEHLKSLALHQDLGPTDRFFWFTTTGWMMWNLLVSGLLTGSAIVLFDGDPGFPDLSLLWRVAAELRVTAFGVSAGFIQHCHQSGMTLGDLGDLGALKCVGSTGSPLPAAEFRWICAELPGIWLTSLSGGTDVCTAFVGGSPWRPVVAGEISCRALGVRVQAFDEQGEAVIGEQGELVVTAPLPSMPVGFWGDESGARYRAAYFDRFPGVWCHGDLLTITERATCIITGRSDGTLNRGGVRLGTGEFYAVVEALPEVVDSLIVHLERGGSGQLLLFVQLRDGMTLTDELRTRIASELRSRLSPRHVPDEMLAVPTIPRTHSGKKLEVPIKRILDGAPANWVVSEGALKDPRSLEYFALLAETRRDAP
ncbi:MAG: acetoacetyl-CoA synthase [Mycobacterium sp.]|nr:acetoacetyl-CoA synthase [Mycobacterium sp.]